MSKAPRLLALTGVAIGGVLAVKAVSGLEAAPAFLRTAQAWAEESPAAAAPPAKTAPAAKAPAAAKAAPGPAPAPACAVGPDALAREAGLSPAELRILQSLGDRRGQLDARESQLQTQVQLLAAAEAKLDAKLKSLEGLKGELKTLLGQADQKEQGEVARLVKVYESMKPKDAAAVMAKLDDKVRLPVAGAMKERVLASVLANMSPADATDLTEKLAARFDAADTVAAKVAAATAPAPAAAPPAKAAPRPAAKAG